MSKYINVKEEDIKQAVLIFNLLKEGKFEVKGDTFAMIATAQRWLVDHIQALKSAKEMLEEQEAHAEPAPAPAKSPRSKK
jgi:hypothetical protein